MTPATFDVVLADPAWAYKDKCHAGKRGVEYHYDSMSMADIRGLPVSGLAAPNAALYLWATPPLLPDAFATMAAWGFRYKTIAFVWIKLTKQGKPAWGMGHNTRANAEIVLYGVKGKGIPVVDHGVHSVVLAPRMEHSRKPDDVQERIERLHGPDVTRVELFARRRRDGWSAWGNEIPGGGDVSYVGDALSVPGIWHKTPIETP